MADMIKADNLHLADFLLAGWEGALLRAKVTHNTTPMRAFIDLFFAQVLRVA